MNVLVYTNIQTLAIHYTGFEEDIKLNYKIAIKDNFPEYMEKISNKLIYFSLSLLQYYY